RGRRKFLPDHGCVREGAEDGSREPLESVVEGLCRVLTPGPEQQRHLTRVHLHSLTEPAAVHKPGLIIRAVQVPGPRVETVFESFDLGSRHRGQHRRLFGEPAVVFRRPHPVHVHPVAPRITLGKLGKSPGRGPGPAVHAHTATVAPAVGGQYPGTSVKYQAMSMTYIWPKASPALFSTVPGILLTSSW